MYEIPWEIVTRSSELEKETPSYYMVPNTAVAPFPHDPSPDLRWKKGSSPASRECRAPKVALKQLVFGKDLLKLPPAITICCAGQRSPHCLVNQHSRRSIRIIRNSLDKGNEMSNPWLVIHPYLDGTWIFGSCVETNYSPFSWVTMQYANYFMDNYIYNMYVYI